MDFFELVTEARSCRRFDESRPLSQSDLEWLVECARRSPCGKNAQDLRFITASGQNVCGKLVEASKWASAIAGWNGPKPGERPTAFIATLAPESSGDLARFDAGIANQTFNLGAASRGWGSCVILSFNHGEAAKLLQLPAGYKISLLIALGFPAEKRVIEDLEPGASFNYWRDEQGVHHVPKRRIEELIVGKL